MKRFDRLRIIFNWLENPVNWSIARSGGERNVSKNEKEEFVPYKYGVKLQNLLGRAEQLWWIADQSDNHEYPCIVVLLDHVAGKSYRTNVEEVYHLGAIPSIMISSLEEKLSCQKGIFEIPYLSCLAGLSAAKTLKQFEEIIKPNSSAEQIADMLEGMPTNAEFQIKWQVGYNPADAGKTCIMLGSTKIAVKNLVELEKEEKLKINNNSLSIARLLSWDKIGSGYAYTKFQLKDGFELNEFIQKIAGGIQSILPVA